MTITHCRYCKAKFVKWGKETINLTSNMTLTRVTASSSKSSTHSSSLNNTCINVSSNDHTEHMYDVIVPLDNDKIILALLFIVAVVSLNLYKMRTTLLTILLLMLRMI